MESRTHKDQFIQEYLYVEEYDWVEPENIKPALHEEEKPQRGVIVIDIFGGDK